MSIPFSPGKLQGKERKNVLQAVQGQAKAAACEAIKPVLQEFLEAEVCAKLGREKGAPRHISGQSCEIDWRCGHCGCQDANQFTRDGHYRRGLETGWGHLSDLRVPMLECQKCQHDVITQFAILEKYKRFWMDLDQDVLFGSGFCQSLRQIQERWSATVEGSVGLRTLNERMNQIEPLTRCAHTGPFPALARDTLSRGRLCCTYGPAHMKPILIFAYCNLSSQQVVCNAEHKTRLHPSPLFRRKCSISCKESRTMTYVQQTLDGLNLPFPEVQQSVTTLSQSQTAERGAIFTKREVVEFMLDLAGYRIEEDLTQASLLEPSFGQGDFLFVAVERLLISSVQHHGPLLNTVPLLHNAIRAVELHHETFTSIRSKLLLLLQERGIEPQDALQLTDAWLVHNDFLLTAFSQRFTHVVGNPPYVRQELLPDALLARYRALYRTIYDRADLYIPFIERSLSLLTSGGTLAFICSDRWMKNRYGGPLREFISQGFHLRYYVDMTGTDAFQTDVTAYPAITVITTQKSACTYIVRRPQLDARFLQTLATTMRSHPDIPADPSIQVLTNVVARSRPWVLSASSEELLLLQHLEQKFPLMEEAGCKVGIGVATGCDAIFIGHREELPIEDERKLPLLMTDDVQTGQIVWSGKVVVNPFDSHGNLIDLEHYPRLKAYLLAHEEVIKKRHVARKNPRAWYRTIDKIYEPLTSQPKLLIPDIKGTPHVVYDEGHYYPHHNLYFVTSSSWDLQALQALLRSSVARFFVASYSVRMRGGYLRFQAQNIRRIRIPRWEQVSTIQREHLRQAAMQLDVSRCDEVAFEVYQISHAERRLLLEEVEACEE